MKIKVVKLFIVRALQFIFIMLPVDLAGILILALILPFIPRGAKQLPKAFRWWDNYESYYLDSDDPNLDGLEGPDYYRERNDIDIENCSKIRLFWYRFKWLALRNPSNYFQYEVMGVDTSLIELHSETGLFYTRENNGKTSYFVDENRYIDYYNIIPYSKTRGFRVRIGYKLNSAVEFNEKSPYCQWVFTVNPFYRLER